MSPRDEHNPVPSWDEAAFSLVRGMASVRVEPSAEHREAANNLMGLFTAMRQSGFTEGQAMKIVCEFISAGGRRSGE